MEKENVNKRNEIELRKVINQQSKSFKILHEKLTEKTEKIFELKKQIISLKHKIKCLEIENRRLKYDKRRNA